MMTFFKELFFLFTLFTKIGKQNLIAKRVNQIDT